MPTLRVFVDAPPHPDREAEWALVEGSGRIIRQGSDRPAAWPVADEVAAVFAASRGRLVSLALPPLPPGRSEAAVRFALEDQLAGAPEDSHMAASAQRADGTLRVAIVAEAWMREFTVASRRCGIHWTRAVLESDLAVPPPNGWCWCAASVADEGFVRTHRDATLTVGPAQGDALPDELALALLRDGDDTPHVVRVDADGVTPALLEHAREQTGTAFESGRPWRWFEATPSIFAAAIDLLSGAYGATPVAPKVDTGPLFRLPLWIAATAIVLYVVAGASEWLWWRWQSAQVERELHALMQTAVPGASPEAAPALAIGRRHAELRHRAGLASGDDFLPLMARAAPVLATLPRGAIRALRYADAHLVIELQQLDAAQPTGIQRELQRVGLVALAAPTATGARLRIGLN